MFTYYYGYCKGNNSNKRIQLSIPDSKSKACPPKAEHTNVVYDEYKDDNKIVLKTVFIEPSVISSVNLEIL
jgi:hypothetical protein